MLLIAFLSVLGCFTAITIVGTDPSSVATLRDALIALGGGLTGVAVGTRKITQQNGDAEEDYPSS